MGAEHAEQGGPTGSRTLNREAERRHCRTLNREAECEVERDVSVRAEQVFQPAACSGRMSEGCWGAGHDAVWNAAAPTRPRLAVG